MYIPTANEEKRIPVMQALIASNPLAALVTLGAAGLIASHIPMVLEADGSQFGLLRGHVARSNTQWSDLVPTVDALAIFAGPQHYISPSWYPAKAEHGKVVPTWNYAVVHAYGPVRVIEDKQWLRAHVSRLTTIHEARLPGTLENQRRSRGVSGIDVERNRWDRAIDQSTRRQMEAESEPQRKRSRRCSGRPSGTQYSREPRHEDPDGKELAKKTAIEALPGFFKIPDRCLTIYKRILIYWICEPGDLDLPRSRGSQPGWPSSNFWPARR